MAEILPILIASLALLSAILAVRGFELARWTIAFLGLASGQIYIAIAGFAIFLLVENKFRLETPLRPFAYTCIAMLASGIVFITMLSPTDLRTFSELAQLALYLVLFLLLTSFIEDGARLMLVLKGAFFGSIAAALIGQMSVQLGWLGAPDVYVGRGSNEGATFMSLVGVVSGSVLFVRTRNPLFILGAVFLTYTQVLATSRSSIGVSAVVMAASCFFVFQNLVIRTALAIAAATLAFRSLPLVAELSQGQMNFSARERLALIEHGWYLSFERFWTGFGWGSTDRLAESAPTTRNVYPHFHNTYVQILAELGLLGWILLLTFVFFMVMSIRTAFVNIRQPSVSALVVTSFLALTISANFDALLFGADRSVQVVFLMALVSCAIHLGAQKEETVSAVALPKRAGPDRIPSTDLQSDTFGR